MMGNKRQSYTVLVNLICHLILALTGFISASSLTVKRSIKIQPAPSTVNENEYIPFIVKAAAKLPADRFVGDPVLIQSVDKLNSKTYYKLPEDNRTGATVFTRQEIDTGKPIIVFDDNGDNDKSKYTYVVLKQAKGQKNAYYANFAYMRKFLSKDDPKETIKIGKEKMFIEWDKWTQRHGTVNQARSFGWTTCTESAFVSCKLENLSVGKGDGHDYSEEVESNKGMSDKGGGVQQSQVISPMWGLNRAVLSDMKLESNITAGGKGNWIKATNDGDETTEGGDVTETFDFFADLQDSPAEAKTVGVVLKVISTPVKSGKKRTLKKSFVDGVNIYGEDVSENVHDLVNALMNGQLSDVGNLFSGILNKTEKSGRSVKRVQKGQRKGPALQTLAKNQKKTDTADIFSHVGWKTQDVTMEDLANSNSTNVPFVGFGTCPNEQVTVSQLNLIRTPKEAVNIYLSALRNQCFKRHANHLLRLFEDNLLTINGDKTLSVPTTNKLLTKSKLTPKEIEDLSKAFEFAMFSQVFANEFRKPTINTTAPDGSPISPSVYTLTSLALHTLTQAAKHTSTHFILLSRNILQTLKTANSKVLQDHGRLSACTTCSDDEKQIAKNDVFSLQAMQYFIASILMSDRQDFYAQYESFFKNQKEYIGNKTNLYILEKKQQATSDFS